MPNGALERCNTIEECYEFMLAYAAKGLPSDEAGTPGTQIREFLQRAADAMTGIAETCAVAVIEEGSASTEKYHAFLPVLERDARDSLAAIELVLAQPSISSQLVDNLNASVHPRTLLTDLFLVGEILRSRFTSNSIR